MKIAVMSDIHGNMEALNVVMEDINKQGIKKIFILGDLALAGPEPKEAVEYIMNMKNNYDIEVIQGNTDKMISDALLPTNAPFNETFKNAFVYATEYALDILSVEEVEYLMTLPPQKSLKIGNLSILLVHGSPRKNNKNIYPDMPAEQVEEMVKGTTEDIIFCGHTHMPAGYQLSTGQTVVNDGSVGRPVGTNRKATYVVFTITDADKKEFEIEHKFIEYDYMTAVNKLSALDFEGSKDLAELILDPALRYPKK